MNKKSKRKIRYRYVKLRRGESLDNVRCPICGHGMNWIKSIEDYSFRHQVALLAECWSGNIHNESPTHLFIIRLKDLPVIEVTKTIGE
jgi:hypothetical protein